MFYGDKVLYGNALCDQNFALDGMKEMTKSMRVGSKTSLLPFQKGILMSINSLKGLFEQLKREYGINYIQAAPIGNRGTIQH